MLDEDGCLPGDVCKHALYNAIHVNEGQKGEIKIAGVLLENEQYTVFEVLDAECGNPLLSTATFTPDCGGDPCCPDDIVITNKTKKITLNECGVYLILFTGEEFSEARMKVRVCDAVQCC